jgi:alanine racemase
VRAASIDLAALARNIRSLTDALGVDRPLVDLRASAYGHGLVAVARASTAAGATALRVSSPADAILLRDAGVECDVFAPGVPRALVISEPASTASTPPHRSRRAPS